MKKVIVGLALLFTLALALTAGTATYRKWRQDHEV